MELGKALAQVEALELAGKYEEGLRLASDTGRNSHTPLLLK